MWDEIYKIKMNHLKVYNDLIQYAKLENRKRLRKNNPQYVYYECHHIIPKCLGGTNDKKNLVLLTAREHFICHKLLTYIYLHNRKIICAFHKMTFSKRKNYKISSRDYCYSKELMANSQVSEETKIKMSISQAKAAISYKIGKNNPAKRTEVKDVLSKKLKGKFVGDKNPMAKSSRKRQNLELLKEKGIELKGDTHEYLRKKIKVTNLETNEISIFDGAYNLIKSLNINKRKYYAHLKDNKPILGKYVCQVL